MYLKFGTDVFFESLMTNPSATFRNSQGRANKVDQTAQITWLEWNLTLDWDDIWYSGIFAVSDYESKFNIWKLKLKFRSIFDSLI